MNKIPSIKLNLINGEIFDSKNIDFAKKFNLKYQLASDLNDACEKLGIWVEKSMYGKKYFGIDRSTFIIDTNGKILFSWNKVKVKGHVDEVLSVAKSL